MEVLYASVPGCDVPLIFWGVDEHYVLQGECFVLGLMEGEAMYALGEGVLTLEELEIHSVGDFVPPVRSNVGAELARRPYFTL